LCTHYPDCSIVSLPQTTALQGRTTDASTAVEGRATSCPEHPIPCLGQSFQSMVSAPGAILICQPTKFRKVHFIRCVTYDMKIKDAWLMWNLLTMYDVKTEGKGGRVQTLKGHACMFRGENCIAGPNKNRHGNIWRQLEGSKNITASVEVVALESETMPDICKASSKLAHAVIHGGASCL
jgi:hypothetical protein